MPLTDKDLELAREHARDAEKINADLKEGGDELRKDPEKRKEWEEEWGHMVHQPSEDPALQTRIRNLQ